MLLSSSEEFVRQGFVSQVVSVILASLSGCWDMGRRGSMELSNLLLRSKVSDYSVGMPLF